MPSSGALSKSRNEVNSITHPFAGAGNGMVLPGPLIADHSVTPKYVTHWFRKRGIRAKKSRHSVGCFVDKSSLARGLRKLIFKGPPLWRGNGASSAALSRQLQASAAKREHPNAGAWASDPPRPPAGSAPQVFRDPPPVHIVHDKRKMVVCPSPFCWARRTGWARGDTHRRQAPSAWGNGEQGRRGDAPFVAIGGPQEPHPPTR